MDRGTTEGALLIELGGRSVEYRFARRRRRTLGITVDAAGLRVAAPLRAPWREIEAFLRDKERWILRKLDEWAATPRGAALAGVSGETLPLFGAPYVLEVGKGRRGVEARDGRLVVTVPQRSRPLDVLIAWLKHEALQALRPRVGHYAAVLNVRAPRVTLSNARTQWGVCSADGAIRLSWRLVHLDAALADYVVAHELTYNYVSSATIWAAASATWRSACPT